MEGRGNFQRSHVMARQTTTSKGSVEAKTGPSNDWQPACRWHSVISKPVLLHPGISVHLTLLRGWIPPEAGHGLESKQTAVADSNTGNSKIFLHGNLAEVRLHRSKAPMCKSLVLKEMPLNEAKHSELLRIRYAKISELSPLSKEYQEYSKAHALSLSTLREAGTKSWFFTPQLEVFQHDREPRKATKQKVGKRESLLACVGTPNCTEWLCLCHYQSAAPARAAHSLPLIERLLWRYSLWLKEELW